MKSKVSTGLLLLGLGLATNILRAQPAKIWDLFGPPKVSQLSLSPDGRRVAFLSSEGGRTALSVVRLDTLQQDPLVTGDSQFTWLAWANNYTVLFGLDFGDLQTGGIFAASVRGGDVQVLMPTVAAQLNSSRPAGPASFLGPVPGNDREILIQYDLLTDGRKGPNVYRVDLVTGKRTIAVRNPGRVMEWTTDEKGEVRVGLRQDRTKYALLHRAPGSDSWKEILAYSEDQPGFIPIGFGPDPRWLYALEDADGSGNALVTVDSGTGQRNRVIFDPPAGDVIGMIRDPVSREIVGAWYRDDRIRAEYWQPDWARRQAQVDAALPGRVNLWVDGSRDGRRFLVESRGDRTAGEYHLYETDTGSLRPLFRVRPDLPPDRLSRMLSVSYSAADGLKIPAYLTLPSGGKTNRFPLVVMPHGGPWIRDEWGWDPVVQFLATRGYAVLQPNYRGSSGYGRSFLQAGDREWGRKMQDDLAAGVTWAVAEGHAHPERVAIFGASYGGYAALMGLIRTPDLYRCAISYVPVTDLRRWLRSKRDRHLLDRRFLALRVGDRSDDGPELREASPMSGVKQIQAPVLFAWGGQDDRIDPADGHRFVEALQREGKVHRALFKANEGHGFESHPNIEEFFGAVESFLAEHLRTDER